MKRSTKIYHIENPEKIKNALLIWAREEEEVAWLDSNDYAQKHSSFDAVLAVDGLTALQTDYHQAFDELAEYRKTTGDWLFGYLTYDLKNDLENLQSGNHDSLGFPELYFFQPKKIIMLKGHELQFLYLAMVDDEITYDFDAIQRCAEVGQEQVDSLRSVPKIHMRIHKDAYHEKVRSLLHHIHRGDIYEANFCQEFYAEDTEIDPLKTYQRLNAISKPPFATYMRLRDRYLISASPERYLRKKGEQILSQPIKGTARRASNAAEDLMLVEALGRDLKERSENVMIVDLVRNDLSRVAVKGSVEVEELCRIYTFEQVHQMISTVKGRVLKDTDPLDIIRATFPMGSMTGAPKISAMKIIEELEETKRGLYSGAVGYFTPEGDFDFNVIIRSILYNAAKRYVSFSVGSAITARATPENEYEECLVKAKAMREVLEGE
ncbi:aminodeoxychorismate synthase component I [Robertkochia aurantiaca]|uniref:aminodeoxychorismate synthase component I n=1 Tax=Robertkochia aurantiaca TaxID=2873700 RepID=UPI001CCC8211|nr:aminodeoxychorismate synthase component I [Robertkochia sp. 3YJGBD-33]